MITVKVSYTVKPELVEANKANINTFLSDFKKLNPSEFRYNVYLQDDGITFLHFSTYKNEEIQKQILNISSFKSFQEQRDKSGLGNTHKVEILSYVGSSFDVL
ncbi:hypothetical protein DMB65_04470 [Flavobacterium cheongpyeongense]|uniref:ABM domain-containing protein n=1 Tax=Flavobacterium cheongpyeongense TaxID=2212651 RepID=A0A2V4BVC8_9FLAO|nr:hypothetical protein [Flavobacterium cheongpyeongense]PXY41823.1 hypothetical protein DMB65_04470 [Flavobacterium cheongpyeongense]